VRPTLGRWTNISRSVSGVLKILLGSYKENVGQRSVGPRRLDSTGHCLGSGLWGLAGIHTDVNRLNNVTSVPFNVNIHINSDYLREIKQLQN